MVTCQGWTNVRKSYSRALEQGTLLRARTLPIHGAADRRLISLPNSMAAMGGLTSPMNPLLLLTILISSSCIEALKEKGGNSIETFLA